MENSTLEVITQEAVTIPTSKTLEVTDNYEYHLYFVPLLYLFYYTFNVVKVYFLMIKSTN